MLVAEIWVRSSVCASVQPASLLSWSVRVCVRSVRSVHVSLIKSMAWPISRRFQGDQYFIEFEKLNNAEYKSPLTNLELKNCFPVLLFLSRTDYTVRDRQNHLCKRAVESSNYIATVVAREKYLVAYDKLLPARTTCVTLAHNVMCVKFSSNQLALKCQLVCHRILKQLASSLRERENLKFQIENDETEVAELRRKAFYIWAWLVKARENLWGGSNTEFSHEKTSKREREPFSFGALLVLAFRK